MVEIKIRQETNRIKKEEEEEESGKGNAPDKKCSFFFIVILLVQRFTLLLPMSLIIPQNYSTRVFHFFEYIDEDLSIGLVTHKKQRISKATYKIVEICLTGLMEGLSNILPIITTPKGTIG
ncbi:hypothetical protein ACJX0J_019105, partial [Zea mays]